MAAEGQITADDDLSIVNSALIQLGQTPITEFGQNSGTAIIAQSSYNRSRDDLLRRQPWNFARKWVRLNQLQEALVNLDIMPETSGSPGYVAFTGAFQIPNDALRVFRFSPRDAHWRIVGREIFTDAVPAQTPGPLLGVQTPTTSSGDNVPTGGSFGTPTSVGVEYIRQVTEVPMWDAIFKQCFVFKLMKELSFGVTGLMQAYGMAKGEFDEAMKEAAAVNGIENWPDEYWNTDLATPRYGYVGVTIQGY